MKLKKSKYLLLALLLTTSIGLTGCGDKKDDANKTQTEQQDKAKVQAMTGEQLQKIESDKKDKENYLVIDVRPEEEYKEGHVKFAINMPLDTLKDNLASIDSFKDKNVVVYCNSGKKSADAANLLVDNGFKSVYDADGVKKYNYDLVKFGNELGPQFKESVDSGKTKFVIDAREAKDFKKGAMKDAVNIMPDDYDKNKDKLPTDKNEPIYVYCYSGNKSATIAENLIKDGYTNVINAIDGSKEYDYGF